MYNTTKCCRVVAAVGIERENVQCFFFFILALKVAWSERVDASYHSLTGFVSFLYHKRKKKKSPSRVSADATFPWSRSDALPLH